MEKETGGSNENTEKEIPEREKKEKGKATFCGHLADIFSHCGDICYACMHCFACSAACFMCMDT